MFRGSCTFAAVSRSPGVGEPLEGTTAAVMGVPTKEEQEESCGNKKAVVNLITEQDGT